MQIKRPSRTEGRGAISTQVIQEFHVAATKKLGADPLLVKDIITSLERFETVVVTPAVIKEAIDCATINRLSFWDSLIIAAAESAKCDILMIPAGSREQVRPVFRSLHTIPYVLGIYFCFQAMDPAIVPAAIATY